MTSASDRNHADQVWTEGQMAPERPYTGDGKTRREPHDRVESVTRDRDGRRQR